MSKTAAPTSPIQLLQCETCPASAPVLFARDGKKVCANCNAKAHDAERAKIHAAAPSYDAIVAEADAQKAANEEPAVEPGVPPADESPAT